MNRIICFSVYDVFALLAVLRELEFIMKSQVFITYKAVQ